MINETSGLVLADQRGAVLTLTLNRPERMNAWTRAMETRYFDLLDAADDDPSVKVVVLTGAGRGFCPGMDTEVLKEAAAGRHSVPDPRPMVHPLTFRKPLIAAINGGCAGIGLVQALLCDVRFVASGARIATAFVRRGLPAEFSASWMLSRLVGSGHAMDLLLSARPVEADEAARIGLVNRVHPPAELLGAAVSYAEDLAANCSPLGMAAVKAQVPQDWLRSQFDSFTDALALRADPAFVDDYREGVTSYVERRPPSFPGLPPRRAGPLFGASG